MEVTEIILEKVSRLYQLFSHSRGFLSMLQSFKSIGASLWTMGKDLKIYSSAYGFLLFVIFISVYSLHPHTPLLFALDPAVRKNCTLGKKPCEILDPSEGRRRPAHHVRKYGRHTIINFLPAWCQDGGGGGGGGASFITHYEQDSNCWYLKFL